MPVHEVAPGKWQWGTTGKVYGRRKGAERQAAAIFASGWREDARARRLAVKVLSASKRAEGRYVLDLVAIMRRVHKGVLKVVHREHLSPTTRADATAPPFPPVGLGERFLKQVFKYVRPEVEKAFDRAANDVENNNAKGAALLGIQPRNVPGLDALIDKAREANVSLISNASKDFLDQVRGVLEEKENARPEDIAALLQERVGVSKSRAQLIARDQVLKLNSAITQHRQKAAGVSRYRWSGSLDERERPMHRALEGKPFSWDAPPVTNDAGDENHPGEDYQCRCIPLPIIDELEPEEQAPAEQPAAPPVGPETPQGQPD